MKLNLGCGRDIRKGYVNSDFVKGDGIDVVWDLDKFTYPFEDNSCEEIIFRNIIEHLLYPDKAVREIHRIAKNGCKVKIRCPHFSCPSIWWDLTHRRGLCWRSFDHYKFGKKLSGSLIENEPVLFKILKREIEFSKLQKTIGIMFLANKFPTYYDSFFAYIFPARDITFQLEVIK